MNEQLLERIAIALEGLSGTNSNLGFKKFPGEEAEFIHIGALQNRPWFYYPNDQQTAIEEDYLYGTITKIVIRLKESKGGFYPKLNIYIKADINYILQAGLDTYFSRGLLTALGELNSLDDPVYINPQFGSQEDVIFCSLLDKDGNNIRYDLKHTDGIELVQNLEAKFPGLTEDRRKKEQQKNIFHTHSPNRDACIESIKEWIQYHKLDIKEVKSLLMSSFGVEHSSQLTDEQIVSFNKLLKEYAEPDF